MQCVKKGVRKTLALVAEQAKQCITAWRILLGKGVPVEAHLPSVRIEQLLQEVEINGPHEGAVHKVPNILGQ